MLITLNSADPIVYFMIKKSDFFTLLFDFVLMFVHFYFSFEFCVFAHAADFSVRSACFSSSIHFALWVDKSLMQISVGASGKQKRRRKLKVIIIFVTLYFPMLPWEMRHRLNSITMLIQIDCEPNQRETRANIREKRRRKKQQVQKSDANWMKNWRRVSRTLLGWVRATVQNRAYIFERFFCIYFTTKPKLCANVEFSEISIPKWTKKEKTIANKSTRASKIVDEKCWKQRREIGLICTPIFDSWNSQLANG